jgi:hypothetical protein
MKPGTLTALPKRNAEFIEPMACAPVTKLTDGPGWVFEILCGDERYVALTLIGDLAKQNFTEKHHMI